MDGKAESDSDVIIKLKQSLLGAKQEILSEVEKTLDESFQSIFDKAVVSKTDDTNSSHEATQKNTKHIRELPIKVFVPQNSVLTELWSISHINSAYNICTAIFILLLINVALLYIADNKRYDGDIEFLRWIVKDAGLWVSLWFGMKLSSLLIFFPLFRCWAITRKPVSKTSSYDVSFAILFLVYLTIFVYWPASKLYSSDLSPVTSFFILVEQTRIGMKVYAFARENIPKVLSFKLHQDADLKDSVSPCPEFNKFLYFSFAPTVVYRDEYPRTKKIRWEYVAWNFLQVFLTIVLTFIAFRRFVVEIFQTVGHEPFTPASFVLILCGAILVGTMSMFAGFYGLLHCWMNAFAEMLTFADRIFYKDWWNCTSFAKYYRTWNTVVHDWLYTYIYRDMYRIFGYRQVPAMMSVFLFSAIVHEYILAFTMKFVYPVLFFMFVGFGVVVVFLTRRKTSQVWNIFMWCSLFLGWGLLIVVYSMEWYARKNCHNNMGYENGYFNIPRSWTCKVLHIPFFIV